MVYTSETCETDHLPIHDPQYKIEVWGKLEGVLFKHDVAQFTDRKTLTVKKDNKNVRYKAVDYRIRATFTWPLYTWELIFPRKGMLSIHTSNSS